MPYTLAKHLLIGLFDLIGYRIGIRRKLAIKQLQEIFPQYDKQQSSKIIRRMYRHMAINAAEIYLISDKRLLSICSFENRQFAEEALSRKKGALLITGHFGNWEAPLRILPMVGLGVAAITKKQRNARFDDYTTRIRQRQGGTIIDMNMALRGVLEHTKHNDLIGILIDQNAGKRGILMDFLGKPASTWSGTAKMALRFQIPIVPGFVIRDADDRLVFHFDQLIDPAGLVDNEENVALITASMNAALEEQIRKSPEQWFWVHKRWKGAVKLQGQI